MLVFTERLLPVNVWCLFQEMGDIFADYLSWGNATMIAMVIKLVNK